MARARTRAEAMAGATARTRATTRAMVGATARAMARPTVWYPYTTHCMLRVDSGLGPEIYAGGGIC